MKITKTVTETKTIEVDITFPYYCKSSYHYYKIINENTAISVFESDTNSSMMFVSVGSALVDSKECTAEEFENQLNKTLENFKI